MRVYVGCQATAGTYAAGRLDPAEVGGAYHLQELQPSEHLWQGYQAALALRQALAAGTLERTQASVKAWLASSAANRETYQRALAFLQGERVEQAERVFKARYREEIQDRWAALALVSLAEEVLPEGPLAEVARSVAQEHAHPFGVTSPTDQGSTTTSPATVGAESTRRA